MAGNRLCRIGLAVVFLLSAGLFFATRAAWRREPALELALLSIVTLAAIEAVTTDEEK